MKTSLTVLAILATASAIRQDKIDSIKNTMDQKPAMDIENAGIGPEQAETDIEVEVGEPIANEAEGVRQRIEIPRLMNPNLETASQMQPPQ